MYNVLNTLSPVEIVQRAQSVFSNAEFDEMTATREDWQVRFDAARSILQNEDALKVMQTRFQNAGEIDVDFVARVLRTRCIEIEADIEEFRRPKFFLDMFRSRNLIRPIRQGLQAIMQGYTDYAEGPVRFIGDKTDDWPTTGTRDRSDTLNQVKYFGKSLEYGILELWQAQCEGRDIVTERVQDAIEDMECWIENLIAVGAPLHGMFGFLNHPDIPRDTVAASLVNGPNTDWPSKTPGEVLFDLNAMREESRVASNYNKSADTLLLSDLRYSYIGTTEANEQAETILQRHLANQRGIVNGGLENILPFVPYDDAGAGGTPMATAGTFDRQNIEMPLLTPQRLPVEYHGSKWKIGFVGAAASVSIKRRGCFQTWEGI